MATEDKKTITDLSRNDFVGALEVLKAAATTAIIMLEKHNTFDALRVLKSGLDKVQEMCPLTKIENVD